MINQLWWNHSNFNWKQIRRPIQGGARWKSLVRREHAMIFGGLGGLVPGKNGLASQAGSGSLVLSTFWHAFDMFFGAHRYFCMPLTKNTDIYAVLSTLTLFKTSQGPSGLQTMLRMLVVAPWSIWLQHIPGRATALKWTSLTKWWWTKRFTNDINHD